MISNDVPQLLKMHDEQRVVVRRKYAVKQDCKLYYPTVGAQWCCSYRKIDLIAATMGFVFHIVWSEMYLKPYSPQ